MSCPHSETTAILAVFGEAPDEFELHLSTCSECRDVVSTHLKTLGVIEPVLADRFKPEIRPMNRYAFGFLLAAAVLLAIQFGSSTETPTKKPSFHTQTTVISDGFINDPIDDELASLEMEIALFNLEES